MKLDKLGWIVAAGMAGALAMSGFQGPTLKFANCDVGKVFIGSPIFKQNSEELEVYKRARTDILRYIHDNRQEMLPADAHTYADLSIAKSQSDSQKSQISKIVLDTQNEHQAHQTLIQKASLSPDDQATMQKYTDRGKENDVFLEKLGEQYQTEVTTEGTRLQNEALDRVKKSIHDYATKQGYNIVFSIDSAPYAANNITDEVLKEVIKP